ncbi:TPA: hypothetical protein DIS55_03100 [Candidatus Kaiserbacteria bacterium]|uniref:DNA polymerase III delta N-terminal domain-containing protein n=1 Tax=Candidatus Kaiserbacteria bacterium RIFCSPLOWO2_12_FULL_50_28 TaxID=1798527 RepID=A0A1F6FLN6_9BACT|nr:MAG: hypothetical protein A3H15_01725 [Candidatus Kaiserbacteria bacterium RIFCSPLOWO2_12_FULL_50_28]HCM43912.1 hypothetical protein [Candidatus Kaiserbacteria bacterium]
MLYFFSGTDRNRARAVMHAEIERLAKGGTVVRITDAHTADDLRAALQGPGMFWEKQALVFEEVLANEDMRALALDAIPYMATLKEAVFWFEEKPDADTRRKIEKRAEKSVRHDAPKKEKDNSVFSLAEALQSGDKKRMWIEYQSALAKGNAPEAIHGILFWGAKKILLTAHTGSAEWKRGTALIAELAEIPHEARRRSVELEYALERYILNINKA